MSERTTDALIEAVLSPYRRRDAHGRPIPPAEWWDLPPEALDRAYHESLRARTLERELDPRGRSGTVRAVMGQLNPGEER